MIFALHYFIVVIYQTKRALSSAWLAGRLTGDNMLLCRRKLQQERHPPWQLSIRGVVLESGWYTISKARLIIVTIVNFLFHIYIPRRKRGRGLNLEEDSNISDSWHRSELDAAVSATTAVPASFLKVVQDRSSSSNCLAWYQMLSYFARVQIHSFHHRR